MAKGKKSKRSGVVSKSIHCQNKSTLSKQLRREYNGSLQEATNKLNAHRKGRKTWVTISNPNPNETNKRFIRVLGKEVFR